MEARYNEDNWVLNENGEPRQVEGYNHSSLWLRVKGCEKVSVSISKNKVKPILLTEDILLKCPQFEKWEGVWRIEIDEDLYLRGDIYKSGFNTAIDEFDVLGDRETVRFRTFKYLHDLQNFIYNPETGEELNIQL
jgi:hypothetical protein